MLALKLVAVGNSLGFVLPTEVTAHLKIGIGDTVFLIEASDGYRLTIDNPVFEERMDKAREIMKCRRNALRALAE